MFPTKWYAAKIEELGKQVDVREIDLIVIGEGVSHAGDWPNEAHVVCFSDSFLSLPGPTPNSVLRRGDHAETEQYLLPDMPLSLSRLCRADLRDLSSVRGWWRLRVKGQGLGGAPAAELKKALANFKKGAIVIEHVTDIPLATRYMRSSTNLGVAWLPYKPIDRAAWVYVLCTEWAQVDNKRLLNFGDWMSSSKWMILEELNLASAIESLEREKRETIAQIEKQIDRLQSDLALVRVQANNGIRRLLTTQAGDLVDEVAQVLQSIGFEVELVDTLVEKGSPKREDLRLRDPSDKSEAWEAIVEVRGYARSGGNTADLQRWRDLPTYMRERRASFPTSRYILSMDNWNSNHRNVKPL